MRAKLTYSVAGAWSLVATGVGHLAIVLLLAFTSPDPAVAAVLQVMASHSFTVMGIGRTHFQLSQGFSILMGIFCLGLGATNLLWARAAPGVLSQVPAVLFAGEVISGAALVLAFLTMPPPPMVTVIAAILSLGAAIAFRKSRLPRLGASA